MNKLLIFIFIVIVTSINAQDIVEKNFERKGFIFGTSLGISSVSLKFPEQETQKEISLSLPNFKIGSMISNRTALMLYLPGSIYTYKDSGRVRDRGFEAILPAVQFWIKDRLWVLAGAGIGLDAPAFYDIENEDERKFYFGGSMAAGAGYEIWRKNRFAIDLQGRIHYGSANLQEGNRTGMAYTLSIGINWY